MTYNKGRLRLRSRLRIGFFHALTLALTLTFFFLAITNGCGRKGALIPPEDGKKKEGKGLVSSIRLAD